MNHRINMLLLQKKFTGKEIRLNLKPNYRKTLNNKYILLKISGFLDESDIYELCRTCTSLNKIIRSNTETENKFLKGQVIKIKKFIFKKYIEQKKEKISLNKISKEICLPETIYIQEKTKFYSRIKQLYYRIKGGKAKKSNRINKSKIQTIAIKDEKNKSLVLNTNSKIKNDEYKTIALVSNASQNQNHNQNFNKINDYIIKPDSNVKENDNKNKNHNNNHNENELYVNRINTNINDKIITNVYIKYMKGKIIYIFRCIRN